MKTLISFPTMLALLMPWQMALAAEEAAFPFDVPSMKEEALAAGIDHSYNGPWEYYVGGGVASFDCNGDRMPDIFLAGGSSPASLYVNKSKPGQALQFSKIDTGISEKDLTKVLGAYPIHLDRDGQMDLVVLRLGENLLLKGDKDCHFTKVNREFSFNGGRAWTTAFSAKWEAEQTFPTLAFGNYIDRTAPGSPWGTCEGNSLNRAAANSGDIPDYSRTQALEPGYCALSMLFTDWNNTGQLALRVTNDRQYYRGGEEQLWDIQPDQAPRQFTAAQGWKKLTIWGMGISEADLNADGRPEYALSSMGDTMIQTLDDEAEEDRPVYRDMSYERQATAHRPYTGGDFKPSTGWHTQFADFNNDSITDLFIAKGNVQAMPDFAAFDPDNLLMGGADKKFHEMGDKAGIALNKRGRGAAVEDYNADGMLDLLVVNREENISLFRNLGAATDWGHRPMGNWLKIELQNNQSDPAVKTQLKFGPSHAINPTAIGAKITVKTGNLTQSKTVQIGGGHASGQAGFIHFGLGVSERADIRIQWPDGEWSHEYKVFANNHVVITKNQPKASYWFPVEQ